MEEQRVVDLESEIERLITELRLASFESVVSEAARWVIGSGSGLAQSEIWLGYLRRLLYVAAGVEHRD